MYLVFKFSISRMKMKMVMLLMLVIGVESHRYLLLSWCWKEISTAADRYTSRWVLKERMSVGGVGCDWDVDEDVEQQAALFWVDWPG